LLLGALLAVAQVLPVPYVALLPGPAVDTLGASDGHAGRPLIEVAGRRTYPARGGLLLTTVAEQPHLTLGEHCPAVAVGYGGGRSARARATHRCV